MKILPQKLRISLIFVLSICSILFLSVARADTTCITNFAKKQCANFQILPRVIVKTQLSKKALANKLKRPVQRLAVLQDSSLYLVNHKRSLAYANKLQKDKDIIYAQPDVLQKRHNQKYKTKVVSTSLPLTKIWKKTKGKGIKIAIIDDGFNLQHEDLKGVRVGFQYDVEQRVLDASPKSKLDKHGTQVAGVIFAQHNGIGVNGIAPEAELIAIRQTSNITSKTILAFTVAKLAKADIINCSWKSAVLMQPVYDVILNTITHGRKGKGTAVVFAAGNSAKRILPLSSEAAINEAIIVGATQAYSNYGASVDFVIQSGIKTTKIKGYGYFGGTSATAPIISGLLALKMSKEKNLTIKELIIKLKEDMDEYRKK